MRDERLIALLEAVADQLGVPVKYAGIATEDSAGEGGGCRVRGRAAIILERTLSPRRKAQLLADALADFDLEGVYLLPAVRDVVDRARSVRRGGRGRQVKESGGTGSPTGPA